MKSGASYTGTVRQLTVRIRAADSSAPRPAAARCHSPMKVSTPMTIWRKATVSPAPTGWATAKSRSGAATAHGWSEPSQATREPRSSPSK